MKRKSDGLLDGGIVQRKRGPHIQLLDLPMDVICDIISRLSLRDAIRTSILSSRWKHVWCHHTNLTFRRSTLTRLVENYRAIKDQELIARVDGVLRRHSGAGIQLMEVSWCALHNKHADHLNRWVKFAAVARTKELVLRLSDKGRGSLCRRVGTPEPYSFPCHLLEACSDDGSCSSLRRLELTSVSLSLKPPPPGDFSFNGGFPNLKKLSLVDVNITSEDLEYFLSECSLLEFLEIACCRMLTSIRAQLGALKGLKHLLIENCIYVQQIAMSCGLTTLNYTGRVVPLQFPTITSLRNVRIHLTSDGTTALDYISTGFISTSPQLEAVYLQSQEHKRAALPVRDHKFIHLRHLRLNLKIFGDNEGRKTDVLDYAYLLDYAPFMETLELHMWMQVQCRHQRFRAEHGELRLLHGRRPHAHLRSVYITGFFGHKDQVELALHILGRAPALEKMKIDSRVKIIPGGPFASPTAFKERHYLDGYLVAAELVRGADQSNVVEAAGATMIGSPRVGDDGHLRCHYVAEPEQVSEWRWE